MSTANGRRLSENTITRNKDAYALYHAAAGQRRTAHRVASSKWLLKDVADKDLKTAKSVIGALRRKSKSELVLLGWENAKQIKALEEELKLVRAKKLDAIVPYSVKVLRPLSRR